LGRPVGIAGKVDGRVAPASCEPAGKEITDGSNGYFGIRSFAPFWPGQIVYISHCENDYDLDRKNRKTYGSVLVRFFGRKMHFAPFF
jgi:hypothetical protein